jgi:hypothetical protein
VETTLYSTLILAVYTPIIMVLGTVTEIMRTLDLKGRTIVAFAELSKYGSNRTLSLTPIATDGSDGYAFNGDTGTVNVWGIDTERGQRIADAYESGDLPTNDRDKLNQVLNPSDEATHTA